MRKLNKQQVRKIRRGTIKGRKKKEVSALKLKLRLSKKNKKNNY